MAPGDGDEVAALSSAERSPLGDRIRHRRDGPYYIAPDSAEPLPDSIWQRIDLEVLHDAVERSNQRARAQHLKVDLEPACVVAAPSATRQRPRWGLRMGQEALAKVRKLLPG